MVSVGNSPRDVTLILTRVLMCMLDTEGHRGLLFLGGYWMRPVWMVHESIAPSLDVTATVAQGNRGSMTKIGSPCPHMI